jgi:hypothetical protein
MYLVVLSVIMYWFNIHLLDCPQKYIPVAGCLVTVRKTNEDVICHDFNSTLQILLILLLVFILQSGH